MGIFPLAPDQTIAQMLSNGIRGETEVSCVGFNVLLDIVWVISKTIFPVTIWYPQTKHNYNYEQHEKT